jgi:hypothetical protein
MTYEDEIAQGLDAMLSEALSLTADIRKTLALEISGWLDRSHKRTIDNVDQRLIEMRKRIQSMCTRLELVAEDGRVVVKASGDAETVLRMLELGTDWFPPAPIEQIVLAVLA